MGGKGLWVCVEGRCFTIFLTGLALNGDVVESFQRKNAAFRNSAREEVVKVWRL